MCVCVCVRARVWCGVCVCTHVKAGSGFIWPLNCNLQDLVRFRNGLNIGHIERSVKQHLTRHALLIYGPFDAATGSGTTDYFQSTKIW
jgi:hypothetical protein